MFDIFTDDYECLQQLADIHYDLTSEDRWSDLDHIVDYSTDRPEDHM